MLVDPNRKYDKLTNEEVPVESVKHAIEILYNGSYKRKSSTKNNKKLSSRSHAIFRIVSLEFSFGVLIAVHVGLKTISLDDRVGRQNKWPNSIELLEFCSCGCLWDRFYRFSTGKSER